MMDDNLFISGKRAIFQDTNPDTQGGLSLDQKDQYPSLGVLAWYNLDKHPPDSNPDTYGRTGEIQIFLDVYPDFFLQCS